MGPILTEPLAELLHNTSGRGGSGGDSGGGNGGGVATTEKVKPISWGDVRVWMRYKAHMPVLSLQDR